MKNLKEIRSPLIQAVVSALLLAVAYFAKFDIKWLTVCIYAAAWLVCGAEVLWEAVRNISHGQIFDENFLMVVASIGAFIIGEYPEAVFVMLFFHIGEMFEHMAVKKSRESIAGLMDICPEYANLKTGDGIKKVDPDDVEIGDTIVIMPGERVPLDGTVIQGSSLIDTSSLTGESMPRDVQPGSSVLSGCVNGGGVLTMRVDKAFGESTVSRILELVENASSRKTKTESFITRFAAVYTPIVVGAAVLIGVIPSLITGQWHEWIYRALSFLVVSCPCALVISVPLSYFGGIGGASKVGVLMKGSGSIEALSKVTTAVFDKTGTLTQGVFSVTKTAPSGISEAELLKLAACAEKFSTHPVAQCIREKWGGDVDGVNVSDVTETAGHGVSAMVDGTPVLAGNIRLMRSHGIECAEYDGAGTVVYVACDGRFGGYIVIEDTVRPDAKSAIAQLKGMGVSSAVMLTGDTRRTGESTAHELGIDRVYTELLPEDKVTKVEELLSAPSNGGTLMYVGDGINDAPVLARADVGVAMGGLGSDAAVEASDVVIMTDEPSKIPTAIRISKKTVSIVRENIIFSIAVKILILILVAVGVTGMWAAVFADVGVSVIAILNALRAMRIRKS